LHSYLNFVIKKKNRNEIVKITKYRDF
jgi:hypothetical protein